MVNEQFTPSTIVPNNPKSEEEKSSSDILSNTERAEWAWLKHDEEFDFE